MNTPAHRRTIVPGDNADSTAIERTIGAHLPRSTGYRCSACDAQHGQPHAAGCPETSLSRAATIAADMLAQLDATKLPLAVPAAIGVLRTAIDAAASQVHPDSALPSRRSAVADTMDHAQLHAPGEHHKASAGQPAAAVRAAERINAMHKGVVGVFAAIKAASSLPPLPDPPDGVKVSELDGSLWAHSGDQLHDYGDKCFRAGMEYARTHGKPAAQVAVGPKCGGANMKEKEHE